jgi:hypothetical protein
MCCSLHISNCQFLCIHIQTQVEGDNLSSVLRWFLNHRTPSETTYKPLINFADIFRFTDRFKFKNYLKQSMNLIGLWQNTVCPCLNIARFYLKGTIQRDNLTLSFHPTNSPVPNKYSSMQF